MSKKEKLSRSLQSLLGGVIGIEGEAEQASVVKLNPEDIEPNNLQPRDAFLEDEMQGLVESIKKYGILQPIIVRPVPHGYMLIAGERRWRAAKQVGLKEIPAIIRHTDELSNLEIALIENIQREDLNPIEKARAFRELTNKFGLTQEQVAKAMGKDRSSITNYIRLLDLPEEIQENVSRGTVSMGHARALVSIQKKEMQLDLLERILKEGLSVRTVEEITAMGKGLRAGKSTSPKEKSSPHIEDLEDQFRRFFGTKVTIKERNGKGKIMIAFHTNDEFIRITNALGIHP